MTLTLVPLKEAAAVRRAARAGDWLTGVFQHEPSKQAPPGRQGYGGLLGIARAFLVASNDWRRVLDSTQFLTAVPVGTG